MGAMAGFLVTIFSGIFGFLVQHLTKKVALGATLLTVWAGLTLAFYLAIKGLASFAVSMITNEWLLVGFWAIWPWNADACIAICFAADLAAWTYRYHVETAKAISYIT